MKTCIAFFIAIVFIFFSEKLQAQNTNLNIGKRCGTTAYYEMLFKANPTLKQHFEFNQSFLNSQNKEQPSINKDASKIFQTNLLDDTIPVVIHVVASAAIQALVTDQVLLSQIEILNEDFNGKNSDTIRIP